MPKKRAVLDVNGMIYPDQSIFAEEFGGVVSLATIKNSLNTLEMAGVSELAVKINTPGGVIDEAFAIINELFLFCAEKGLTLVTIASGQVASAGNLIMAAGEIREAFSTSQFFLHNAQLDAWALAFEKGQMEASDFEEIAAEMRNENARLNKYLAGRTGQGLEVFQQLMDEKSTIDATKAKELNLVTVILDQAGAEPDEKAQNYAKLLTNYYHNKKHKPAPPMNKDKKPAANPLGEVRDALKNFFTVAKKHNLDIEPANSSNVELEEEGKSLEFSSDTPTVGDTVTMDGQPAADGTYKAKDGSTIEVKEGKCSAITPKAEGSEQNSDALKTENETLKTQNADLTQKVADLTQNVNELQAANKEALDSIKNITNQLANMKSGYKPENRQEGNNSSAGAQAADTQDKKETAASEAVERKKAKIKAEAEAKAKATA